MQSTCGPAPAGEVHTDKSLYMRILHAAAEFQGLAKTGGLADMVAALTDTLHQRDHDLRICVPAYRGTCERMQELRQRAELQVQGQNITVLEGRLQPGGPLIWLLQCPPLYE